MPAYFKTPSGIPEQSIARRIAEIINPHLCLTDERERLPLRRAGGWQLDSSCLWALRPVKGGDEDWDFWEMAYRGPDREAAHDALEGLAHFLEWVLAHRGPLA